jgi:glyceraldehyde 3-phosphate dehydrogenase
MKKINVAINGFGRIGRSTFRVLYDKPEINVVAINDLVDPHTIAYLLKYDSIFGIFADEVKYDNDHLVVHGKKIKVLSEMDNSKLPWKELDIDIVLESTGKFTKKDKLTNHLVAGAKKVVLSAPPKDSDIKAVVLGVNDDDITAEDHIISNASCTTNCLAPMVKVLDALAEIETGFATTVHAYTADQRLVDAPHKDLRRARAAGINIIPTSTGAAKATALIFPHLKGKLTGSAYRVPVLDGSIADFMCTVKKEVTIEDINKAFEEAAETHLKGILQYTDEAIVSTDIIRSQYSCIFDSNLTDVIGNMVRIAGWYDNESGYSHRLTDLIVKLAKMI